LEVRPARRWGNKRQKVDEVEQGGEAQSKVMMPIGDYPVAKQKKRGR